MKVTQLILAIAIAIAMPRLAFADKKAEVQKHLNTAYAAYKEQRWQDVLDALNKAYVIDPKPELHFSMGQVYVKMGRCVDAVSSYEKYLASKPAADKASVAREAIDACKAQQPPPKPDTPTVPQVRDDPPPNLPQPKKDTGGGGGVDKLGVGLVAGGAVIALAGAGFYMSARSGLSDAEDAPTYGEQVDLYDKATKKRLISIGLGVGGIAIAVVGLIHGVRKKPHEQRRIGLAPTRDGGFVTWTSGF
jgi:tetratricopeptide (TPR) repeat protein